MAGENIQTGFLQGGTLFMTIAGVITPARFAWGTISLVGGVGTAGVGFPIAHAVSVSYGANIGAGTTGATQIDPSLFGVGSVIVRGMLGTIAAPAGGTVGFVVFGG